MQSSGLPSTQVEDFARTVAAALNRRVGKSRGISTKEFAYIMQVSEQSVWSWQGGYKAPSGPKLRDMLAFFDASFANDILRGCGLVATKAADLKTASYFRKVNDASMALRSLGQLCALADEPEGAE